MDDKAAAEAMLDPAMAAILAEANMVATANPPGNLSSQR
jgi:hypothetical protein